MFKDLDRSHFGTKLLARARCDPIDMPPFSFKEWANRDRKISDDGGFGNAGFASFGSGYDLLPGQKPIDVDRDSGTPNGKDEDVGNEAINKMGKAAGNMMGEIAGNKMGEVADNKMVEIGKAPSDAASTAASEPTDEVEDIMKDLGLNIDIEGMLAEELFDEKKFMGFAEQVQGAHDKLTEESEESKEEKELKQALDDGMDLASGLGQRFTRMARAGRKKGDPEFSDYCGSSEAKVAFRKRWLQKRYNEMQEKRVESQEWKKIDFTKASYRNAEYILNEHGGKHSLQARKATSNLIRKCLLLGPPYYQKHPLTDRVEFVNMVMGWKDEFSRSWAQYRTFINKQNSDGNGGGGGSGSSSAHAAPQIGAHVAKTKAIAKTEGKRQGETIGEEHTTKKPKEASPIAKTDNQKLIAVATKIKGHYHMTSSKLTRLLEEIGTKPEWAWARATEIDELETLRTDLKMKITGLADNFLITELSVKDWMKENNKGHGEATVVKALKDVADNINSELEKVSKKIRQLHAMQAQRAK